MLKRTTISALRPVFEDRVYTIRRGLAKGLKRKGGLEFIPRLSPLAKEARLLNDLNLIGKTVYDVGGFEGIFTMFFARRVGKGGRVITFEPNPENYKRIAENVRLNGFDNVDVRQIGLGKGRARLTLTFPQTEPGRGSAQQDIADQILKESGAKAIQIEVDSLDNQIANYNLPGPDFVKIDVEGLEMDVLSGMGQTISRFRPKLLIEIHGADMKKKIENAREVVEFLTAKGYAVFHVESEKVITAADAQGAKEGHIYCVSAAESRGDS